MKSRTWVLLGIVLLLAGAAMLVYRGYNVTRQQTVLNIGDLDVKATTRERVPIPAPLGWAFVVGGALLIGGGLARRPTN